MYPLKIFGSLFFLILTFCACQKEAVQDNSFIFGFFAGECNTNCSTIYKIENNKLYPDQENYFPYDREINFSKTPLSIEKYNIAFELEKKFPEFLLKNSKSTYGCPDCVDQGAFYVQINNGNQNRKWFVDPFEIPHEINDYFDLLKKSLPELIK